MKKEDILPVGDQVFFEIVSAERKTDAGLVLPGAEDANSPVVGKVLKTGPSAAEYLDAKILLARGVSFPVPLGGYASSDKAYLVDKKYILATVSA